MIPVGGDGYASLVRRDGGLDDMNSDNGDRKQPERPIRLASVSFLNALPLTDGLGDDPRVALTHAVPARLAEMVDRGDADIGLVPVIDLVRNDRAWHVSSDACIGCDGATLTVRVFSRVDPADVHTLMVDCDSHSSVAMASVIWREKYGRSLKLVEFDASVNDASALSACEAVLLIGDKVINPPTGIEYFSTHVDLGAAWKSMTGLPFVFAVWAGPNRATIEAAAAMLSAARDRGVNRAGEIAQSHAETMGWPVSLAHRYYTEHLNFTLTDRHRAGMDKYLEFVRRYGIEPLHQEQVKA
jgi:chorismate dehydratase